MFELDVKKLANYTKMVSNEKNNKITHPHCSCGFIKFSQKTFILMQIVAKPTVGRVNLIFHKSKTIQNNPSATK